MFEGVLVERVGYKLKTRLCGKWVYGCFIRNFIPCEKNIFFHKVKNFPQEIENTREIIENMSEIIQNISDIFFATYTPVDYQLLDR